MVSVWSKLNAMGTDGKLLLSEMSISRNRSSAGCLKYFSINNSFDFTSTDQRHTLVLVVIRVIMELLYLFLRLQFEVILASQNVHCFLRLLFH